MLRARHQPEAFVICDSCGSVPAPEVWKKRLDVDGSPAWKLKDMRREHLYSEFSGGRAPGSDHVVIKHRLSV
jgi:hypothetical protein